MQQLLENIKLEAKHLRDAQKMKNTSESRIKGFITGFLGLPSEEGYEKARGILTQIIKNVKKDKPTVLVEPLNAAQIEHIALFVKTHMGLINIYNLYKKKLDILAKELPIWRNYLCNINGFKGSAVSLGQIIGITGDLSNYPKKERLFNRLCIGHLFGQKQRKVANKNEHTRMLAIHMGYDPKKRCVVYNLSNSLLKVGNPIYREVYDKIKADRVKKEYKLIAAHRIAMEVAVKAVLADIWVRW